MYFQVDASDAAIADEGFCYFLECHQIKKLKMNFCDYFSDLALRQLAGGRLSKTLIDLVLFIQRFSYKFSPILFIF